MNEIRWVVLFVCIGWLIGDGIKTRRSIASLSEAGAAAGCGGVMNRKIWSIK